MNIKNLYLVFFMLLTGCNESQISENSTRNNKKTHEKFSPIPENNEKFFKNFLTDLEHHIQNESDNSLLDFLDNQDSEYLKRVPHDMVIKAINTGDFNTFVRVKNCTSQTNTSDADKKQSIDLILKKIKENNALDRTFFHLLGMAIYTVSLGDSFKGYDISCVPALYRPLLADQPDLGQLTQLAFNIVFYKSQKNRVEKLICFILAGIDIQAKDTKGHSFLHYATQLRDIELMEMLIEENKILVHTKSTNKTHPLHIAAYQGTLDSIELLLNAGADVNAQNANGDTSLHTVATIKSENKQAIQVIYALLDAGADVNAQNANGDTPLHTAIHSGNLNIINTLLNSGADVNIANKEGVTPLTKAIFNDSPEVTHEIQKNIVEALTDTKKIDFKGAHKDLLEEVLTQISGYNGDKEQYTQSWCALHNALCLIGAGAPVNTEVNLKSLNKLILDSKLHIENFHIQELFKPDAALKEYDERLNLNRNCYNTLKEYNHMYLYNAFVARGANLNYKPSKKANSLLHFASQNNDIHIAQLLINKGVDVNDTNFANRTPLHVAAMKGHYATVLYLVSNEEVNINALDFKGNTPLHLAAQAGHYHIVSALLERNASINIMNNYGETPLDIAQYEEFTHIENLLSHPTSKMKTEKRW